MRNRYEKFVYEDERGITFAVTAKKGITLNVQEGTNGELIIRALKIVSNNVYSELPTVSAGKYAEVLSVYTDNDGNQAVVPPGWTVSGQKKENTIWGKDEGLIIYRIPKAETSNVNWEDSSEIEMLQKNYDQLGWVPVSLLEANGTLDGISFTEKFGRRDYQEDEFSEVEFHETLAGKLALQLESVKKYDGFYISRYNISKNKKTGNPQSVKGEMPWTNIDFNDAKKVAATLETKDTITSHLTFGAEYDSVLEWFIKSNVRTRSEIAENSTNWGNYWNSKNSPREVVETGSSEEWCTNNIYDFAGNVDEWTQEQNESSCRVIRGGYCSVYGGNYPVAYSNYISPNFGYSSTGFRATLYIK